jgi:ABC-2 type transport system ATP-binding protein
MNVLEVQGLCKTYPGFRLQDVSFSVAPGSIMGFIGRNGAGKTTTLKSLLHIVHPDSGSIRFFGLDFDHHEDEIKQRIGYAGGAVDFYKRKPIRALAQVTGGFYENWDEAVYRRWLDAFSLDESMTPLQLSEGMRVKLSLTLALSHHAELLILDEPTSGLDPVSREELLEAFRFLRDKGVSILFSTHITSDLEKCANQISYISKGRLLASEPMQSFLDRCAAEGAGTTLDEIMVHYEKESLYDKVIE